MKKLIILSSFAIALTINSCKKSYSCACTTNITPPNYYPYQTATVVRMEKKASNKKATFVCTNTAKQMQANTRLLFDDNVKVETSCSVQE